MTMLLLMATDVALPDFQTPYLGRGRPHENGRYGPKAHS